MFVAVYITPAWLLATELRYTSHVINNGTTSCSGRLYIGICTIVAPFFKGNFYCTYLIKTNQIRLKYTMAKNATN